VKGLINDVKEKDSQVARKHITALNIGEKNMYFGIHLKLKELYFKCEKIVIMSFQKEKKKSFILESNES